ALNQTFFIGDGLTGTGSGSVQVFHVPDGATRLYLGFADAFFFQGDPGYYDDNTGSLTATFMVTAISGVPEPGSFMLALLGVTIGAVFYARRRNVEEQGGPMRRGKGASNLIAMRKGC